MPSTTRNTSRPTILNSVGQQIIDQNFKDRSRTRASFLDVADATVHTLKQTGQLSGYILPGTDPFKTIRELTNAERSGKRVRGATTSVSITG